MTRSLALAGLLVCILLAPGCAPDTLDPTPFGPADGWRVFHPLPGGYDLFAVWGASFDNVWAVGSYGHIVHWNGETVTDVDSPVDVRLGTLDAWAPDDIYAAGEEYLLHFDGHAWRIEDRFPGEAILDLHCAAGGRLHVVGSFGLRIRDDDDWRTVAGPRSSSTTVWAAEDGGIRVGDSNRIWLVDGWSATAEQDLDFGGIQHGDGRFLWSEGLNNIAKVHRHDTQDGWVAEPGSWSSLRTVLDMDDLVWTSNSGIGLRDTTDSQIWTNDSGRWIYGLDRCGADGLLACGYGGTLMAGTRGDGGFDWNESALELGFRHLNALDGTGCGDIWAGEWWGRVLHYDGTAWICEYANLPNDRSVSGIQALADGWVLARGGDRISLRDPAGGWLGIPSPGAGLNHAFAVTPDSIFASTNAGLMIWNGSTWRDGGLPAGIDYGLAATASGELYGLVSDGVLSLRRWNGATFDTVAEFPGLADTKLCASRSGETLWIGGYVAGSPARTAIYRYESGDLRRVSDGVMLPSWLLGMTELRSDDLFVLTAEQIWRYRDGAWSRETGLPVEEYTTIWSHPDCGVFVEGHPTFFKEFPEE
ncbi:MAG: hypothetical protein Q7W56_10875 [Candidatus Latescibacteria bacterium]|nr:hypothetical protein [Candidatus Latescibacterota bacterium]